ncbi:hypothetical protein B484DRAFT_445576 [Ochromonadaceae sp. CCMP2298]|nr:hypothetical protein B484DRAFT_445576 [Ochromonadaceae sp. CCMP2298]|mmetsp:Transcript_19262/g.42942  ORF Transcript_19262/g.42942 Transcript_19262/m.42942 type:complete len:235 (-) Transcript_19262:275-979(-)
MFGDIFGQRVDPSLGVLYQARRRFLVPKGENALEPPHLFKTRKQSRRSHKYGQDKPSPIKILSLAEAQTALNVAQLVNNTKKSFLAISKTNKMKPKTLKPLIIQHYSSVRRVDWVEVSQAGCRMYVNKSTGEVSVECPWKVTPDAHGRISDAEGRKGPGLLMVSALLRGNLLPPIGGFSPMDSPQTPTPSTKTTPPRSPEDKDWIPEYPDELGTGSLVYDSELDALLFMLDHAK